jgi:hypothetical protein
MIRMGQRSHRVARRVQSTRVGKTPRDRSLAPADLAAARERVANTLEREPKIAELQEKQAIEVIIGRMGL